MKNIKLFIIKHKKLFAFLLCANKLKYQIRSVIKANYNINKSKKNSENKIFYLGVPSHSNLGDLAQFVCIKKWLKTNYPNMIVIEIESDAIVGHHISVLKKIAKLYNGNNDFIIMQSGYTTTDLGGNAELMHRLVMEFLPSSIILMMPQTIFFKNAERKQLCSTIYNNHKKMLFLARDNVSFEMAKEMFPNIPKLCFPDIVTTLIGTVESNEDRDGICFCLRDDGEKFYSDNELQGLINKCQTIAQIHRLDTTKQNCKDVVIHAEKYIYDEIKEYGKYKVMITDRYHGTILSLVAGTPVIIIKTTDHKVTTGADWFKGVYDDYVFLAKDLDEAYVLAKKIYSRKEFPKLKPYFEENYYNKLPKIFNEVLK